MKKIIILCAGVAFMLSACNTIAGLGQDLQGAGSGVSTAAEKTKDKIENPNQ